MSTAKTPGQVAFEAHRDTLDGNRPWSDVREPERQVWEATADAVRDEFEGDPALVAARSQVEYFRELTAAILNSPEVIAYALPASYANWREAAGLGPLP